jgi:signal transduction histidine kinase
VTAALQRSAATVWRWSAAHPRIVDTALAVLLVVVAVPALSGHGPRADHGDGNGGATLLLLAAAGVALVFRRDAPLPVWGVTVVTGVLAVLTGGDPSGVAVPTYLALFTLGLQATVATTVATTVVSGVAYTLAAVAQHHAWLDERGDVPGLQVLAWAGAAAAVGVAVRMQRAALDAAEARAHQAEQTREEEAERRVTDERVRIARELHDIVAHHISVINVQSGVARHLMDSRPEQAREALGLVRDASKTVLAEMSAVVGLLRTPEEDAPTEPAPGLARIDSLVDSVRRAGLEVTTTFTGKAGELPPIQDLTAYRVVQESLTNAVKYGTGRAQLVVDHGPEGLCIEVRNPMDQAGPVSSGGGHGLIGMRERVESVRGRFTAGPGADGVFTVSALIPRGTA